MAGPWEEQERILREYAAFSRPSPPAPPALSPRQQADDNAYRIIDEELSAKTRRQQATVDAAQTRQLVAQRTFDEKAEAFKTLRTLLHQDEQLLRDNTVTAATAVNELRLLATDRRLPRLR